MNIISLPTFNIVVSEKSARQALIQFVNKLIERLPFVCDRIYSYMEQDYLVDSKQQKRHIVAKRPELLNGNTALQKGATAVLSNGWSLMTHDNPIGYVRITLARIEEALGGLPIIAVLETVSPGNVEGYALRNIEIEQVRLLNLTC